jgi:AcrR family transcriptional regulator
VNVKLGLTRERVLSAAATLADTEGLPAVTVSSVARVVGVKPPSLYAHVRSTDELHAALTVLALDELADAIDGAHATRLVASMLRGFIQLEAAGAFAHREPRVEETWPLMLGVLDAAIRAHC